MMLTLMINSAFCLTSCSFDGALESESETDGGHSETEAAVTDSEIETSSEIVFESATDSVEAVDTEKIDGGSTVEAPTDQPIEEMGPGVLSFKNLNRLSEEKNIVFFLIDRFDVKYFEKLQKTEPEFLEGLDGFTFYNDYTSLYCRTYPAIASILTGKENDFTGTRLSYFQSIYTDGGHMRALHENGYSVNVYTQKYYAYDDASYMREYVDNVSASNAYDDDMKGVYEYITKNEFTTVKSEGQFSFIHLYGCHTPIKYNLNWDEANEKEKNDTTMALKQSLTIIYEYIEEMKELGLYENATIVITGDHPAAISDTKLIGQTGYSSDNGTRVTAMLFKRSGESGTELRTSTAQISQDELWNTIYESEGLTSLKNGDSFFDISEDEERVRRYLFELSVYLEDKSRADEIVEYKITGSARDAENWEIAKRTVIGKIYK